MFALPTLREFIDNPMGKGSNAIPSRQLVRNDLAQRLAKMEAEGKKVQVTVYRDGADVYYYHLLIPTESPDKKNTYDVLLKLFIDGKDQSPSGDVDLHRYQVQFFSNSPSFTYTYLYAFDLHGFFIRSYEDKFKSGVLDDAPVTRNPAEIINYEKTISFAVMYLLKHPRYLDKSFLKTAAIPYKHSIVHQKVRHSDRIHMEIEAEKRRVSREKEKEQAPKATTTRDRKHTSTVATPSTKTSKSGKIKPRGASKSKIRPRR